MLSKSLFKELSAVLIALFLSIVAIYCVLELLFGNKSLCFQVQ